MPDFAADSPDTPGAERAHTEVAIIGGGPAGLCAAEVLCEASLRVEVYDAMPSVGRKFLMAGKGGLNLTHTEPYERFAERYASARVALQPMLDAFRPEALRAWALGLGVETFVGTSGRVFPVDFKAAPLLRAWLHRLRQRGVRFHVRNRWQGWTPDGALRFDTPDGPRTVHAGVTLLALGGGSWARLGSDGAWVEVLRSRGIASTPLRPANCGFDVNWSTIFAQRFAGAPVKAVRAGLTPQSMQPGEFVITATGVEGSLIYALSAPLRDRIDAEGAAILHLDLAPGLQQAALAQALSRPRAGQSLSNVLRRQAGLEGVKAGLLREPAAADALRDAAALAARIKCYPLRLVAARPLDEAISTAGGVRFESLDEHLMLKALPGVFCAGEMLDWEAPTGGYLLTACMATARHAGAGVLTWLRRDAARRTTITA